MDKLHLQYGLILGTQAGNAGMPLIRELVEKAGVSVNARVRVDDTTLTPLTHAAETHCYDNVYYLASSPGIDVSAIGSHGWPAFLSVLNDKHILECRNCENLLDFLWSDKLLDASDILRSSILPLDNVLNHTVQIQSARLTRRIVKLLTGAVGPRILPLLVIVCDRTSIRWALSKDSFDTVSTRLWVLLCDHLHKQYDEGMHDCFRDIAVTAQGWGKWSKPLALSIISGNFAFAKHLFQPISQQPDGRQVRETVRAYAMCSHDDELIREWVYSGHASATLWNRAIGEAIDIGVSSNRDENDAAQFAILLKDDRLNFNATPPARVPNPTIDHFFITASRVVPSYEEFSQIGARHDRRRSYQALADSTLEESIADRELVREHLAKRRKIRQDRWESQFKMPTLLLWAAQAGRRDLVLRLTESPGVDPNYQDIHGCTPLMYAAARNDLDNVGVLLSRFDNVEADRTDRAGRTALMYAAQAGFKNVVIMLIGSGRCDPSLVDHMGLTAAAWALRAGHTDIVQSIDHPNEVDIIVDGVDQDTNELGYWLVKNRELRGGPSTFADQGNPSGQDISSIEGSSGNEETSTSGGASSSLESSSSLGSSSSLESSSSQESPSAQASSNDAAK
jgi:hypothetical protein